MRYTPTLPFFLSLSVTLLSFCSVNAQQIHEVIYVYTHTHTHTSLFPIDRYLYNPVFRFARFIVFAGGLAFAQPLTLSLSSSPAIR